jgi:hypothetical protein
LYYSILIGMKKGGLKRPKAFRGLELNTAYTSTMNFGLGGS